MTAIAERQGTDNEYYLGDALGSVRHIVNDGDVVYSIREENSEAFSFGVFVSVL